MYMDMEEEKQAFCSFKQEFAKRKIFFLRMVQFHRCFNRDYRDVFRRNYDDDKEILLASCDNILERLESFLLKDIQFYILYALVLYRRGVYGALSKPYNNEAFKDLKTAKKLIEKYGLEMKIPYEYMDVLLYLGSFYLEIRADERKIRECYVKIERVIDQIGGSINHACANRDADQVLNFCGEFEHLAYSMKQNDLLSLSIRLGLGWMIFGIETCDGKSMEPKANRESHKRMQLEITIEYGDRVREKIIAYANMTSSVPIESIDSIASDPIKNDLIIFLITYWSTLGLYYLKTAEEDLREKSFFKAENGFKRALKCFLKSLLYDQSNTVAMNNIAFILYVYRTRIRGVSECIGEELFRKLQPIFAKDTRNWELLSREKLDRPEKIESWEIDRFLAEVNRIETRNMYALSLRAYIMARDARKDWVDAGEPFSGIYTTLRQAVLRKRFEKISTCLNACDILNHNERTGFTDRLEQYIILLYNIVSKFISHCIVSSEKHPGLMVAHYTKLRMIPCLITEDEIKKFRLYNMEHLNDPQEGRIFLNLLGQRAPRVDSRRIQMLPAIMKAYASDGFSRSSVYIGSFCENADDLSMWSRYGDGGKGCSFVVAAQGNFDEVDQISLDYMTDKTEPLRRADSRYALYKVIYLPDEIDCSSLAREGDHQAVRDVMRRIEECMGEIDTLLEEYFLREETREVKVSELKAGAVLEEIKNTLMLILDQARFLIKSDYYQDEREYRVIKYASTPQCDRQSESGVPRLYVDMKRPLRFDSICLGPLVTNPASIAAYPINLKQRKTQRCGHKVSSAEIVVRKSKIKFQ